MNKGLLFGALSLVWVKKYQCRLRKKDGLLNWKEQSRDDGIFGPAARCGNGSGFGSNDCKAIRPLWQKY